MRTVFREIPGRNMPNLEILLIATKGGFPIFSVLPKGINEDRLAALNASLLTVAEQSISEIGLGNFNDIIIKGKEGYVLGFNMNDDVFLTASVKRDTKLGLFLFDLRRLAEKIKSGKFNGWGDDDLPYLYIFKPPTPPGDLGVVGQAQLRDLPEAEDPWDKLYCKNCGSLISEGELVCHTCGKKVV